MLVDDVPDEVAITVELVAVTALDISFTTTDDVPNEAVATIKLVVEVTSKTVADAVESTDPGSVGDIGVIKELTDPGSVGDVGVIKELTDPGSVGDVGVIKELTDPGSVGDVGVIKELTDPGSVGDVGVIKELTDPGSVGDIVIIIESTGSVFVVASRVEVMIATGVNDTFKVITLSAVDMPIDASLSIIEIVADILIKLLFKPTTTTIFIVITTSN